MTSISRLLSFTFAVAAAIACLECGSTASSPTSPFADGASSGAVISGRVTGAPIRSTASSTTAGPMATTKITVAIVGTDIATAVDGTGQFTLTGVPPGDVQLKFSGPGVDGTITLTGVSATDRISIVVSFSGNGPRLDKEDRDDDDDDNDDDNDDDDDNRDDNELEGTVSGLTGTCPSLTFTVQQTTIKTNGSTAFKDGPCANVANGKRVEVEGTRQADGTIMATEVELD